MTAVLADAFIATAVASVTGLANGLWLHWMRGGS